MTDAGEVDWRVGLASVCITPEEPVWLYGYASKARFRPYDEILDDVYAKAMAVGHEGGEPAVLITADLCVLREPAETALCEVIVRKTGLARERILLNWSHTHSGPMIGTSDLNRYCVPDEDLEKTKAYTRSLWNKLADVAAAALADMKPARLSWGVGQAEFVKNRRAFQEDGKYRGMAPNPDRYVDRCVPVLRIDTPDGQARGVVFGCACHAVTLGSKSNRLSGDYPSFARQHVERQYPGVEALFVQGCGGDANPDPRATDDQVPLVQRQGRTLGAEVCRVVAGELHPVRGPLRVEFTRVDLPLKAVPPCEELEQLAEGPFWQSHNARRILQAQQRGETIPTHYRAPLALWQFSDDLTLVAISGEVVSDYVPLVAGTIESDRLWVAGYCNQVFGYLPSARVVQEGGYESLGLVSAHIGWFSADVEDVLLAAIRQMKDQAKPAETLAPVVEVEEDVYTYEPADNGSGPMWCFGSTCLVRIGSDVFVSGLETLKDAKPLNNVRWLLLKRETNGWRLQQTDQKDRTREPCPLIGFSDGQLLMSVNPTLATDPDQRAGPARPEILQFSAADPKVPFRTILPQWDGTPKFTEHSYRSFAADGRNGELILMQNIGNTHSEWAVRDRNGDWIARGKLAWPEREDPRFAPYNSKRSRVNYSNVVLRDRALHYCGASAFNKWERVQDDPELMGREKWGSRMRRLFYTWTPDVTTGRFSDWIAIASTHHTGGWLFAQDMWVDPQGIAHILWIEYPIHPRLRDLHFPDIKRTQALKYARVCEGKVVMRRTLVEGGEGLSGVVPGRGRLQISPDNRLAVFYYVSGTDASSTWVSENRVMEILPDGSTTSPICVPLEHPISSCFTATPRGGSPPSTTLDVLGTRVSSPRTLSYARIRLW